MVEVGGEQVADAGVHIGDLLGTNGTADLERAQGNVEGPRVANDANDGLLGVERRAQKRQALAVGLFLNQQTEPQVLPHPARSHRRLGTDARGGEQVVEQSGVRIAGVVQVEVGL